MMMNEREMRQRAAARRREEKKRKAMRARFILAGMLAAIILLMVGVVNYCNNAKAADVKANAEETFIPQHEGSLHTFKHEVKGGESLGTIAADYIQQYGSTETVESVVNRIINENGFDRTQATYYLQKGQVIRVPLFIKEELN